jgi:hypothetical protein
MPTLHTGAEISDELFGEVGLALCRLAMAHRRISFEDALFETYLHDPKRKPLRRLTGETLIEFGLAVEEEGRVVPLPHFVLVAKASVTLRDGGFVNLADPLTGAEIPRMRAQQ